MYKLVLIRHGESVWNKENRFTGWKDVPLSERGHEEAADAGRLLLNEGFPCTLRFQKRGTYRSAQGVVPAEKIEQVPLNLSTPETFFMALPVGLDQ